MLLTQITTNLASTTPATAIEALEAIKTLAEGGKFENISLESLSLQ